ncbi:MFS transporter [Rhizorhabdus dicambivorans]|uniref:MFS transporter n=1 Tax=Rhizorhabdus dicambivorans TaxID=1850238 RepID=UPI001EE0BB55|nr:MFS transporter [Rhizorhabdus dicambivorans]
MNSAGVASATSVVRTDLPVAGAELRERQLHTGSNASAGAAVDAGRQDRANCVRAVLLCAAVALLDGFDTQAIAFVAPAIAQDWRIDASLFGAVFGAGLLGLMLGSITLGPLADRFGRRAVIIWSTVAFGAFALLTPLAADVMTLAVLRFLTGLGLGGAVPNIIALTSEYAPPRVRATLVTIMYCGFPMGAVVGGLISAPLMSTYGWESVFVVGGLLPILLAFLLFWALPESASFLSRRKSAYEAGMPRSSPSDLQAATSGKSGLAVRELMSDGRGFGTLLLWFIFFANLLTLYFLVNWLPSLLVRTGFSMSQAIHSLALLNGAGIVGGLAIGRLIDRGTPLMALGLSYLLAAVSIVGISVSAENASWVMTAITFAGMFVIGAQFGMNALATTFYPTAVRATGLGWALGVGRLGSFVGPLLGGMLWGLGWKAQELLFLAAIPSLLAALAVHMLSVIARDPGGKAAGNATSVAE